MKRKDLLWGLLYPIYQTIGTIRHEGAHALAAMAEGVEVNEFVFWPTFLGGGRIRWGYVSYSGSTTWFFDAAPYFSDLITFFAAVLIILVAKPRQRWLRINIIIIGILSSLVNSATNYVSGFRSRGDVGWLLHSLDPVAVHTYFILTLVLYAWGMYYCYSRKKAFELSTDIRQHP